MLRQMIRGSRHGCARGSRQLRGLLALVLVVCTALPALAACSVASPTARQADAAQAPAPYEPVQGTVRVFAASSLSSAFAELADGFEDVNPGIDVQFNFGASSALREQILDGAPAHVFASASEHVMVDLVEQERAEQDGAFGDITTFASNQLVLAVPASSTSAERTLAALADDALFVGLCALDVPCGDLAAQVLAEQGIEPQVDTYEPNARALTSRLRDGDLDVGLVYATDAAAAGDDLVITQTFPSSITRYPIGARSRAGQLFVDYVTSTAGQAVLASWGFGAP